MGTDAQNTRGQLPGVDWSLEQIVEYMERCFDRDTILDILMGYSAHWFTRRMTLIVGRGWVQLFGTDGFDLPAELPKDRRRAEVDDGAVVLTDETATGKPADLGLEKLFEQLEIEDSIVRSIGVSIGARVAVILVGTLEDESVSTASLKHAARLAGTQLENVIKQAKRGTLPPDDQRVPPFPEPSSVILEGEDPSSVSFASEVSEPDIHQQKTKLVDSIASEADAPPAAALSEAESSGVSDVEADPSATSEGLPFTVDDATEIDMREPSDSSSPETVIGSPFREEKFPGEIASESSIPSHSGSDALGDEESTKTQMGGISAQADLLTGGGGDQEDSGTGTMFGTPSTSDVDEAHTPFHPIEAQARSTAMLEEKSEEKVKDWKSARDDAGVPAAMIIKPARKRPRSKSGSGLPAGARKGETSDKRRQSPRRTEKPTPVKTAKPADTKPREPRPPKEPSTPKKRNQDDYDPNEDSMFPMKPSTKTPSSGAFARGPDTKTRRFGDDDVDDAWFDYFAEGEGEETPKNEFLREEDKSTGKQTAPEESEPGGFSLDEEPDLDFDLEEAGDEPSLPPQTLERLLDSGPQMVDMQEQFLILDSRDKQKAFAAAEEVADLGETAIEILEMMFPGRVFLDRYQFADGLPPVDEHGPVLNALVRIGDQTVPIARKYMTDTSNETRFYAVFLLTKLNAEEVLGDLFERLFDRDQQIRQTAADIVLDYQGTSEFRKKVQKPLRNELLSDEDLHVTVASNLLAELRDTDAVIPLIDTLEASRASRVKQSVINALTQITLHSWSSPYEWRQWWKTAQDEPREDWLVDAMDSASAELRSLAFDEIQRFPALDLNYHPDQPSKLRKRAQKDLRKWLAARSGH